MALIVLGLFCIWLLPETVTVSRVAQAKQELVTARQNALAAFMADKGAPPRVLPADAARAIAPNEVAATIGSLLDGLSRNGSLPPEIGNMEPEEFWSGNWTPGTVAAVTSDRTILIGFYVNTTAAYPRPRYARHQKIPPAPQLVRVFGLFRRSEDGGNASKPGGNRFVFNTAFSVC